MAIPRDRRQDDEATLHEIVGLDEAPARPAQPRILLVDDDDTITDIVSRYLERAHLIVDTVGDAERALESIRARVPDLVILDIGLPGINGFETCRRLRGQIPIIFLTARGDESDRVFGLELGADDYVPKPFSPKELTARVKAVLRRTGGPSAPSRAELAAPLSAGDLHVDLDTHEVRVGTRTVKLTPLEFALLVFLMRRPGVAFGRNELLEHVWGYSFGGGATVTVHIRRLREKLERDPAQPIWLQTVWGIGYRFSATSPPEASLSGGAIVR